MSKLNTNYKKQLIKILNLIQADFELTLFTKIFYMFALAIFGYCFSKIFVDKVFFNIIFALIFSGYHIYLVLKKINEIENVKRKIKIVENDKYDAVDALIKDIEIDKKVSVTGKTHSVHTFISLYVFVESLYENSNLKDFNVKHNLYTLENKEELYNEIINDNRSKDCKLISFTKQDPIMLVYFSDNFL